MIHRYLALCCLALGLLGLLAACGADPLKPTPTPADLVARALADTKSLTRYHYTMRLSVSGRTDELLTEGDAVVPDQIYMRSYLSPTLTPVFEALALGGKYYMKQEGAWVTPEPLPPLPPTPEFPPQPRGDVTMLLSTDDSPSPINTILYVLTTTTRFTEVGTESLNVADDPAATPVPVTVRHFTYTVDPATPQPGQTSSVADFATGGSVYIDPVTGHLYRFTMEVDQQRMFLGSGPAAATWAAGVGTNLLDTPDPAAPTPTPFPGLFGTQTWTYTLTRHNDPAITIPTP